LGAGILHEPSPSQVRKVLVDDSLSVRLPILKVQIFKDQQLAGIHPLAAFLMGQVGAAVRRSLVGRLPGAHDGVSLRRSDGKAFWLSLQTRAGFRVFFHPALTLNFAAVAHAGEGLQSQINPDHFIGDRQMLRLNFAPETGRPLSGVLWLNRDGLDRTFHRTMPLDLPWADLGKSHCIRFEDPPIAVRWVGDTARASFAFEARIARRFNAFLDATKERWIGQIDSHR
jgi:hypothetical protein